MSDSRKRSHNGETQTEHNGMVTLHQKPARACAPAPFTYEDVCQEERDTIDYSIKISKELAASGLASRPVRIYSDGIYDMFHSGHARQLMQAKSCFPNVYLLVGVSNDTLTHSMKGRTVMNEEERYEAVRHCRYVDELVSDAPWVLDDTFLQKHKIDFVAHDDLPYGGDEQEDIYGWLKDRGMFVATERTEGISTTDVIARIIKDYDVYVRRNLTRGYTPKELNVGYMKAKTLRLQEKVDIMKGKFADKRSELFSKWEEKSREFIGNFMELFSRDGRLNHLWNEGRMRVARAISPPVSANSDDSSESTDPYDSPPYTPVIKRRRVDRHKAARLYDGSLSD